MGVVDELDHQVSMSLLTVPGASFEIPDEMRRFICLTADGALYVSDSHHTDHRVLTFKERLRHNGFTFVVKKVSLEVIAALYSNATQHHVASAKQDSTLQTTILRILEDAAQDNASDVHILIKDLETSIRFRVHGRLTHHINRTREEGISLCQTLYNTMTEPGADPMFNMGRSQDASMSKAHLQATSLASVRLATRPTDNNGLLMVLRLTKKRNAIPPTIPELGYIPEQEVLIELIMRREGILVISGPTGSGKTTTLACMMAGLLRQENYEINLLTIEHPVEHPISGAVHTPIICDSKDPEAIEREWPSAISNIVRLDPDNLMIGEIRDEASAKAAVRAAITGHGVYTTLHTKDAASILERLRDIGVDDHLLFDPDNFTGLINQKLARGLCPHCKEPLNDHRAELSDHLIERLKDIGSLNAMNVVGKGCSHCKKGISTRHIAAEVIVPTRKFMNLYREKGKADAKAYWVQHMGGITKAMHLARLITAGLVDPRHGEQDVCPLDEDKYTLGD